MISVPAFTRDRLTTLNVALSPCWLIQNNCKNSRWRNLIFKPEDVTGTEGASTGHSSTLRGADGGTQPRPPACRGPPAASPPEGPWRVWLERPVDPGGNQRCSSTQSPTHREPKHFCSQLPSRPAFCPSFTLFSLMLKISSFKTMFYVCCVL